MKTTQNSNLYMYIVLISNLYTVSAYTVCILKSIWFSMLLFITRMSYFIFLSINSEYRL